MSPIWRTISVIAAGAAVLAGTLLLMGNLQNAGARAVQLEQSRLDAQARHWETQLEAARAALRDQIVRYDLLAVLYHPEEWTSWRVQDKFEAMRSTWTRENGALRALALLNPDGRLHTVQGDSTRLSDALKGLRGTDGADAALLGRSGALPEVLALQFYSVPAAPAARAGRIVALIEPAALFAPFSDTPSDWTLLSDPNDVLLQSGASPPAQPISEATWTLMVSQRTGIVQMPGGNSVCFARVQIPGMRPMLLIHPVHVPVAAAGWVAAIFSLMGLGVMLPLVWRGKLGAAAEDAAPAAPADVDAAGYRQIVQSIADPICVVDGSGAVLKANRAAHEWLHLSRGRPDDAVAVVSADSERSAHEFLKRAGEDPAAVSGECRMSFHDSVWEGAVEASRLYRDGEGHGPVLLHFRAYSVAERERPDDDSLPQLPAPATESAADPHSPFPVLSVTPDGLIVAYNEAARRACARLEDTPLLGDILPGMDGRHFADVLAGGDGSVFQSLFGPRTHEFTVVFDGERILLYGHPLADSQNLEIEMKQAQENFYGLCALVPSPVLLVDPREHTVIEANAAAGDLFERTAAGLRGQTLDSLSAEPWEPAQSNGSFIAQTLNSNRVPCTLRYELIKVEGVPVLMVVLDRLPESVQPAAQVPEPSTVEPERPLAPSTPPALPIGPGMLITLNPTVREVARRLFDKSGHACEAFTNLDDAVVWIITHDVRPEFLAIDVTDFDAVESWIADLRARCGDVPCIAFTDGETYSLPEGGRNTFLEKPFDLEAFQDALAAVDLSVPACVTA